MSQGSWGQGSGKTYLLLSGELVGSVCMGRDMAESDPDADLQREGETKVKCEVLSASVILRPLNSKVRSRVSSYREVVRMNVEE